MRAPNRNPRPARTRSVAAAFGCLIALALVGCGQPEALVEVRLSASHPRPAEIREVWSTRFRNARDRSLLPIVRASAQLAGHGQPFGPSAGGLGKAAEGATGGHGQRFGPSAGGLGKAAEGATGGLALEVTLRVATCDAAVAEAMRLAVIDLTTARHRLAIHRVAADAAERLATRLRDTLGFDVHTPVARPGQLIIAAPIAQIPRALLDGGLFIVEPTASADSTTLWSLDPTPALDGRAIATAAADIDSEGAAVELTFTDAGTIAMKTLSEATRGSHLVILVDGAFALAPRVIERVSHSLRLELPPAAGLDARALARAIAASNLDDPPTLVTSEAHCLPTP